MLDVLTAFDPLIARAAAVAALLVAALVAGRWWQHRDGEVRAGGDQRLRVDHLRALGLDLDQANAGAVLLGSPTCSPCESVKEVLHELATERQGFRWVYADAADHLDLTLEHRVRRVPTVLVVERGGRIVARSSGVPRSDELRRVLDTTAA